MFWLSAHSSIVVHLPLVKYKLKYLICRFYGASLVHKYPQFSKVAHEQAIWENIPSKQRGTTHARESNLTQETHLEWNIFNNRSKVHYLLATSISQK
jgi:hypothetical protein